MSVKMKVLVSWAAGIIGRALMPELSRQYELVLSDNRELETPHAFILAYITDIEAIRSACDP